MLSICNPTILRCAGVTCLVGVTTYAVVRITENMVRHVAARLHSSFRNAPEQSEALDHAVTVSACVVGVTATYHGVAYVANSCARKTFS